jgi:hypothetical protein
MLIKLILLIVVGYSQIGAVTHYPAHIWGGRPLRCGPHLYDEAVGDWAAVDSEVLEEIGGCGTEITICNLENQRCLVARVLDTGYLNAHKVLGTGQIVLDLPTHTMEKLVDTAYDLVSFRGVWAVKERTGTREISWRFVVAPR